MAEMEQWLKTLSRLNVYRAKGGLAPHKPLLVLVFLQLADDGLLNDPLVQLTPELAFKFCAYWSVVAHRRTQRPDVRLPFHFLKSDGLWDAETDRHELSPSPKLTRYVRLRCDFWTLMQDSEFRQKARLLIIAKYFLHEEQQALCEMLAVNSEESGGFDSPGSSPEVIGARLRGREARFRLQVLAAYNYTCSLTGYRLTTIASGTIVDAAHIHQFSNSGNNEVQNGLSLSKNSHWSFDCGLWTLSDDYKVIVALGRFSEDSPEQRSLSEYHGNLLRLPSDKRLWPSQKHLHWHRSTKFLRD